MINKGIAFGWWQGVPVWVGVVGLIALLLVAVKTRELWGRVGILLMLIGGGVNTLQRYLYGGVLDDLPMFGLGYNNLADYLIFFGIVLYGYSYFVRGSGHHLDR